MPNPLQTRMEDMSIAYLQAICAKNGYEIWNAKHDNDCVDCQVSCNGFPLDDPACIMCSPIVSVQLKASYAGVQILPTGDVQYDIPVRNYNYLVSTNRTIPYILILLVMHQNENLWIEHNIDYLKLTKCAYWACLKGQEPTRNRATQRIVIPSTNVLTPDSLKEIMVKISKQQEL